MPLYRLLLQPIKKSRFSLKRRRCKDLFKRKKYFGVRRNLKKGKKQNHSSNRKRGVESVEYKIKIEIEH